MEQQALSQMHGGVTFAGMDFIATGTHGEVLSGVMGKEVAHILESNGVIHFPDAFTTGFGWDPKGETQFSTDPSQALLGSPQDDLGCNHT
eukprot:scaffold11454_cov17-Tisochrysis_lutea.AAC.2